MLPYVFRSFNPSLYTGRRLTTQDKTRRDRQTLHSAAAAAAAAADTREAASPYLLHQASAPGANLLTHHHTPSPLTPSNPPTTLSHPSPTLLHSLTLLPPSSTLSPFSQPPPPFSHPSPLFSHPLLPSSTFSHLPSPFPAFVFTLARLSLL